VTDTTAQRSILQNAGVGNRYPTIGRFLTQSSASSVTATPVVPPIDPVSAPAIPSTPAEDQQPSADLDLLDNLVTQAVLNRSQQVEPVVQTSQQSSRQKEMLNTADSLPAQEAAVEANPEVLQTALEASENLSAPESAEMQELSAELQEVSKETKEQREQAEIKEKQAAISELAKTATTPVSVSNQPVVVLPITAKSKQEARFKSPKYSVVWLWEWCKKITKIFEGAVVYKEEVDSNS